MPQSGNEVLGRSFRTKQDYDQALKDADRIKRLKQNTDFDNIDEVRELLDDLHSKRIRFFTILGNDFLEEVEEREIYLVQNPPQTKKKGMFAKSDKKDKKETNAKRIKKASSKSNIKASKKKSKNLEDYDADMQARIVEEMYRQEKKRKISVALLSVLAASCIGYLVFYYYQYEKNSVDYENLAELKEKDNK